LRSHPASPDLFLDLHKVHKAYSSDTYPIDEEDIHNIIEWLRVSTWCEKSIQVVADALTYSISIDIPSATT
jgi:hypothetical protein